MPAKLMSYFLLGLIRVLTGSQARWFGCPPKAEQRIHFTNHQSQADLMMIWAALPQELRVRPRAIAARDNWTKTRGRQWLTSAVFNVIYVSRDRNADKRLLSFRSMVFWPLALAFIAQVATNLIA